MKDRIFSNRNVYITAIIVAVALIAIGIFGVWRAFARFEGELENELYFRAKNVDKRRAQIFRNFVRGRTGRVGRLNPFPDAQ